MKPKYFKPILIEAKEIPVGTRIYWVGNPKKIPKGWMRVEEMARILSKEEAEEFRKIELGYIGWFLRWLRIRK